MDLLSLAALPDVDRQPFNYFGLLKLNRMFRLLDLIAQSNIEKGPKAIFQIVFYFSMLIIYLHITGCLWFVVIKSNYLESSNRLEHLKEAGQLELFPEELLNDKGELKTPVIAWQPPYDYFDGSERFWDKYENGDYFFIYCVCLYYSVLVIGGNELGPRETSELVYVVMINLIGAIVNAYIFGELAVLLTQIGRKEARYQHVFDAANTAMSNINLDEKLKEEIRTYFKKV